MITEIRPKAVVAVPPDTKSTVTVGGESIFGAASDFVVEIAGPFASSEPVRQSSEAVVDSVVSNLWSGIGEASRERAERLRTSAAAWTQAGFAHLAGKNLEAARQAFETALGVKPSARSAQLGLARTAHQQGETAQALTILRRMLEESPEDLQVRVSIALVLAGEGDVPEALRQLQGEVDLSQEAAPYLAARGGLRFLVHDLRGAVSDLRKAVRLRPDWAHARNVLGLAELSLGRRGSAERHFREAVRVGPMSVKPLGNLVRLLVLQRRWEGVLEVIERYWDAANAPVELACHAAQASLELGDARGARNWLVAASSKGRSPKERAEILNNLGVAYARLDRLQEAERAFAQSTQEHPTETAVTNRAKALLEMGSHTEVIEWIATWRDLALPDPSALKTLAVALMHAGRNEEAVRIARDLIGRPDVDEESFTLLSALYADGLQDLSAAVESALSGIKRWPASTTLANNLAYALLLAGRPVEAARYLETIEDSKVDLERRVYLTATRGLLALWRGELSEGQRLYEVAAAMASRAALRDRVKAKRDLETARALLRLGGPKAEAIKLLKRASEGGRTGEPYVAHARSELRLLSAAPEDSKESPEEAR